MFFNRVLVYFASNQTKPMNFAQAVINQRKKKGLTQEALAEMSGVSLRTIQRIESETVQPRVATVRLLEEVLGFPEPELEQKTKHWKLWVGIGILVLSVGLLAVWKNNQAPIDGISGLNVKGDLETVRGFDWEETRDIFETNHPNFEIVIGFEVDEPVYLDGTPFNNFKFDVKGKSKNFDDLVEQYKNTVNKLSTQDENQTTQPIDGLEPD